MRFSVQIVIWAALLLFLSSCVSKKKHLLAMDMEAKKALALEEEIALRDSQLKRGADQIIDLKLELAEAKGENNVLVMLRTELQEKISGLEGNIKNLSTTSSSTRENLNQTVQQKEGEINRLNGLLNEVNTTLDRHTQLMGALAGDLRQEVEAILQDQYFIETGQAEVRLILLDDLIFKPKSVVKVTDLSLSVFEKISKVLENYPTMNITVVGHTDNKRPARKSSVDNWNVGAQQAATVVRILSEEYDISPSRILLGAKGEFKPRTSNESEMGRRENRRVELIMSPNTLDLVRAVRSVLK